MTANITAANFPVLNTVVTAENWTEVRTAVNNGFETVNPALTAARENLAEVEFYGHAERANRTESYVAIANETTAAAAAELAVIQELHNALRRKQAEFLRFAYR